MAKNAAAQTVDAAFDGMVKGFKEAAAKRVADQVARDGYVEFAKPAAQQVFVDNNPGWKAVPHESGAIRYYPPSSAGEVAKAAAPAPTVAEMSKGAVTPAPKPTAVDSGASSMEEWARNMNKGAAATAAKPGVSSMEEWAQNMNKGARGLGSPSPAAPEQVPAATGPAPANPGAPAPKPPSVGGVTFDPGGVRGLLALAGAEAANRLLPHTSNDSAIGRTGNMARDIFGEGVTGLNYGLMASLGGNLISKIPHPIAKGIGGALQVAGPLIGAGLGTAHGISDAAQKYREGGYSPLPQDSQASAQQMAEASARAARLWQGKNFSPIFPYDMGPLPEGWEHAANGRMVQKFQNPDGSEGSAEMPAEAAERVMRRQGEDAARQRAEDEARAHWAELRHQRAMAQAGQSGNTGDFFERARARDEMRDALGKGPSKDPVKNMRAAQAIAQAAEHQAAASGGNALEYLPKTDLQWGSASRNSIYDTARQIVSMHAAGRTFSPAEQVAYNAAMLPFGTGRGVGTVRQALTNIGPTMEAEKTNQSEAMALRNQALDEARFEAGLYKAANGGYDSVESKQLIPALLRSRQALAENLYNLQKEARANGGVMLPSARAAFQQQQAALEAQLRAYDAELAKHGLEMPESVGSEPEQEGSPTALDAKSVPPADKRPVGTKMIMPSGPYAGKTIQWNGSKWALVQ